MYIIVIMYNYVRYMNVVQWRKMISIIETNTDTNININIV